MPQCPSLPPPPHTIVVGGGVAGLATALKLAPRKVLLLTKAPLGAGAATLWAQGGIAAAVANDDTPDSHAADTLSAAAGIADPEIVARLTAEAPAQIAELIALGAAFDRSDDGSLALGREAAHAVNRILHIDGDGTGRGLMETLTDAVRACASIEVIENVAAEELIQSGSRIVGVYARSIETAHAPVMALYASAVVLATGGIGNLYQVTTNPAECAGEGLGMAARAGARLADLEFVQFHPTAMDVGISPAPLATEALRGEGAVLINDLGERFMPRAHAAAELAPRDIVAKAVWREIHGGNRVFLDCRAAIGAAFEHRFPTVYALCRHANIDPADTPIPVAPAAHYHMGGIATDKDGRTSLPGLWACGEAASTGAHGANRLASNSLLEGLVFGARAAADIVRQAQAVSTDQPLSGSRFASYDDTALEPVFTRLRELMSSHVGVVRSEARLAEALAELDRLTAQAGNASARLSNMLTAARMVTTAALQRRESRGGHFREDYPLPNPAMRHRTYTTLSAANILPYCQTVQPSAAT